MDTNTIWIALLTSLVGLAGYLIAWVQQSKSETETRETKYLDTQLEKLYGPLQLYASWNKELFRLNSEIGEGIQEEYAHAQGVEAAVETAISTANEYIAFVKGNNEKILRIMETNYYLIDPDDIATFAKFLIDYARLNIELDNLGKLKIGSAIYQRLGPISFMKSEFIDLIENRFREKQNQLKKLRVPKNS